MLVSSFARSLFVVGAVAASLTAQTASDADDSNITRRVTAASQFFDHDFVNVYAFANGVWDSRVPAFSGNQPSSLSSSLGWEAGGGIALSHSFRSGGITLNYNGSYRDYESQGFSGGTQQLLSLGVTKRLGRRWSVGTNIDGGVLSYGTGFYAPAATGTTVATSPFSNETRFLDAGVSLAFQQTRRLSYVFSGSYFLSNYTYASSFSSQGVVGSASALYRLSARTTIGATYARSYYSYSQNAGTSNIDSFSLSMSHRFNGHWQVDLSGGVNRAHSQGIIALPVTAIFNGQTVTGYIVGPYSRVVYSPSYQGVLTHFYRHSLFAVGGGQSILAGNGVYLASRDQFANTTYSYSTRHSNVSFGGTYSRLSSISNTVGQTFSSVGLSASYGINFIRYVSANLRYDFLHYDNLFAYSSLNENRISFGISLSSKSVPLTLF